MSTTVSYKGNMIAMAENQTKTLKTAGKYMEADVVVTDVTQGGSGGNVWQDQDGYIHLDDEGTPSVTVESLSITQNGTYTAPTGTAYSPVTVNVSGGGSSASSKQIYFIDYDGTIVKSYTKSEWQNVTSLPSNPSHSGLTAQGWNWTKAQIDTQLTAMPDGDIWVGQMYITDDGKTRVYIHLAEERKSPMLGVCPKGTVDVDWGDGTAHDTLTGTSLTTIKWTSNHQYSKGGDYVITLTVTGSMAIVGVSTAKSFCRLLHHTSSADGRNQYYIDAIKKVEIGSNTSIGNYAFYNCYSLTSITVPDGVTSIGDYMFAGCYSLTNIIIPNSVTNIYKHYIFQNCYSLTSVIIPGNVTSSGGSYIFQNCYSLTNITIPNSITSIGSYMFAGCYNLTNIAIPDDTTSIGTYAFLGCSSLSNITIPDGVTSIGNSAFSGCHTFTNITIPDGITSIGNSTFSTCYSLTSITVPDGITNIGDSAFSRCHSLTSIAIPNGITSIKTSTFQSCYSLTDITIPDGVTSIGNSAFSYCYSFTNIVIPNGVTSIGSRAFFGCYSLANITIPSGVTSIGAYAFADNYGMAEYHFLPTTPPTLANINAFNNIPSDCIIYVPSESLEAYQTATNWSTYASYMRGE